MTNPLTALLREPLTYFLIAGAAVFLAWNWIQADEDQYRIEITALERDRITAQWEAQMGRRPTDDEMQGLLDQFVREEIYYREALRLELDKNDTIVRRRLAQKLEFLTEDIATAKQADNAELLDYYQRHLPNYTEPEKYSFVHRYFSAERRKDSQAIAALAIAALNRGLEPDEPGDAFMLQSTFTERSLRQVADLFGGEFAQALSDLEAGSWQGPIPSAYGWHAVMLQARIDSRQRPYDEVATRVANDRNQAARQDANERYYETLKNRYRVTGR